MAKITGTGKLRCGPAKMGSGATPASFFRTSRDFLQAVEALAKHGSPAGPLGSVAGQCLELALKAYLLKSGMTEQHFTCNKGVGHDLKKTWEECADRGLKVGKNLPPWAKTLNDGHGVPHKFRYPKGNTGIVLAAKPKLLDGLRGVLATVGSAIEFVSGS